MNCGEGIYNCMNCFPTPCHKAVVSTITFITITTIVISIIGLAGSPAGPLNAITHLGKASHGVLLGFSVFAFILELFWISELYRNRQKYIYEMRPKEPLIISHHIPPPDPTYTPPTLVHVKEGELKPIELYKKKSLLRKPQEEQKQPLPFTNTPFEICYMIFSYLSPHDLGRCQQVNKEWQCMGNLPALWNSFDLRTISSSIRVVDQNDWKSLCDAASLRFVLDEPELDKRALIPFMFKFLSSIHIEEDKGITILTIPKGLTYDNIRKIQRFYFKKSSVYVGAQAFYKSANSYSPDKTYHILITSRGATETKKICLSRKEKLLIHHGFTLPETVELTALHIFSYLKFNETQDCAGVDVHFHKIYGNYEHILRVDFANKSGAQDTSANLVWKIPEVEDNV